MAVEVTTVEAEAEATVAEVIVAAVEVTEARATDLALWLIKKGLSRSCTRSCRISPAHL
jgi:hypothetical protein